MVTLWGNYEGISQGYVLSCQALPLTSDVVVDFDAKGMA